VIRPAARVRRLATPELTAVEVSAIRALLVAAFAHEPPEDQFADDDWQHALGGTHVVVDDDGEIVSHAAVVARELHVAGRPLRSGYVEAVATLPERQGRGFGTLAMDAIDAIIRSGFELGALGTGSHGFYERLGWRTWRGPSSVRRPEGEQPTPEDDGYILVLETPTTPRPLDLTLPISCDWRPGDVW
jgi:aminoglycoside 2'-N-acetyltransferase I